MAASPWQRPLSHFRLHPAVSGEKQTDRHPPPTTLPRFGTLWLFHISKNEIEAERKPISYRWGDTVRIAESAWHSDRKGLPGSVPKMEETVGPVSTCGRQLLRGWQRPIGLIVSFTIFTASLRTVLDTTLYVVSYCINKRKVTYQITSHKKDVRYALPFCTPCVLQHHKSYHTVCTVLQQNSVRYNH